MDLPLLHRYHLQQIHPRQKALQLAFPHLPHHDSHGLLLLPCIHRRPPLQARRTRRPQPPRLPHLRRPHRRSLLALPLALQLRLHLPLCFLHSDAESPDARPRLFHRNSAQEGQF
ncbi:hypothetical protein ACS0TY_021809 [Phlomoides rotata]